jgi:hypothetical protein
MRRTPSTPIAPPAGLTSEGLQAAVQPLMEHIGGGSAIETGRVARAWELYESPEVRFPARQYSNAFAATKLILGRREQLGRDPIPITEPHTASEAKAFELLSSFAGGSEGQVEFLDRMGTYFVVPGDMIAIGSLDPAHMGESKFAKWDLWSTTEVRWDGQKLHIQTEAAQDLFQEQPAYIKHVRIWNRHPRRGWESDSPVLAALRVLELVDLYDSRLAAEALSRLIGAGVWMIPQGMKLPTATGDPAGGTPADFLRLLMEVASIAIKDKRSAAAMVPILVEAAAEDIQAAKDSHVSFSTPFDERIGELQEAAIRRWATGVDLPAEAMLGISQATHWNASLITEDKVQSFIIPSLRRAVGSLTWGWLKPALLEFDLGDPGLVLWFDPAGIKTRVDLGDEAKWGNENFKVTDKDTKYALGLDQTEEPDDDQIKRMMLLHMAKQDPSTVPAVLQELGIEVSPELLKISSRPVGVSAPGSAPEVAPPAGRPGPQAANERDTSPSTNGVGRTARLSTTKDGG